MWQPWQTLANSSSPLVSEKRYPALRETLGASGSLSATSKGPTDDIEAEPAASTIRQRRTASITIMLRPHHALVQPRDGIERRQDRAFLPGRHIGGVFAGEHDLAVDPAQIVVMRGPRLIAPVAGTAECERHPMPGHRHAVFKFVLVLR